jgi:hypothetical protein
MIIRTPIIGELINSIIIKQRKETIMFIKMKNGEYFELKEGGMHYTKLITDLEMIVQDFTRLRESVKLYTSRITEDEYHTFAKTSYDTYVESESYENGCHACYNIYPYRRIDVTSKGILGGSDNSDEWWDSPEQLLKLLYSIKEYDSLRKG